MALLLALAIGQTQDIPAYVREGERVEREFRAYRDRLANFYGMLREAVAREAPGLLHCLQDAPPQPVVYGYQLLPRIVRDPQAPESAPVRTFSYSWPITQGYVDGESEKLRRIENEFGRVAGADFSRMIEEYQTLVANQRTIDQYVQYNRFWQRAIAMDRARFDQLTRLYEMMKSGDPEIGSAVAEVLGRPETPASVRVIRSAGGADLRVPVYTDIEDDAFLTNARTAIENLWQADDSGARYRVSIEFRRIPASQLYRGGNIPRRGDHLDMRAHVARFPSDGVVLTTGAETTHGFVGRYVALGPGDLSRRTLAHEFGHALGFRDGYIRGYRDLGGRGFEILELTSSFDDIMSAPRQGRVQAAHFRLIMDALAGK